MRSGFCILTRHIYGYSGTELPPRVEKSERFTYLANEGEPFAYFKGRMEQLCSQLNSVANQLPVRPYSLRDYWGASIHELTERSVPDTYMDPSTFDGPSL